MAAKKSIILLASDPKESRALFSALVRAGHSVTDTHRADYAMDVLADRCFEAAVLDLHCLQGEDCGLIETLCQDWSCPIIVGVVDFDSVIGREWSVPRGARYFMGKPIDIRALEEKISSEDTVSRTDSNGADILDYIQRLEETGKDAVLDILGSEGQACRLFVSSGRLIHAVCGHIEGEKALVQALTFEGGSFRLLPWTDPPRVTIEDPVEQLLTRHG